MSDELETETQPGAGEIPVELQRTERQRQAELIEHKKRKSADDPRTAIFKKADRLHQDTVDVFCAQNPEAEATRQSMMTAETPSPIRSHASIATICGYLPCAQPFTPRKRWQLFCSDTCRLAQHRLRQDGGLRGVVKSNKLLKGGRRSVTLHFDAADDAVLRLEPGTVAEILLAKAAA